MKYYIIGDIHGSITKLRLIFKKLIKEIKQDDIVIFLGDYIDRGESPKDVLEYLCELDMKYNCIFIKGNHEDMLQKFLNGELNRDIYYFNGGEVTLNCYKDSHGAIVIPKKHQKIIFNSVWYFEANDFIAVHAGLPPQYDNIENIDKNELIWIRDEFYNSNVKFKKTIIFGHTITSVLNEDRSYKVYFDEERNIIGIDTGAAYGGKLTCLRWPDLKVFQS